jgi:hypothetical protein
VLTITPGSFWIRELEGWSTSKAADNGRADPVDTTGTIRGRASRAEVDRLRSRNLDFLPEEALFAGRHSNGRAIDVLPMWPTGHLYGYARPYAARRLVRTRPTASLAERLWAFRPGSLIEEARDWLDTEC